MRTQSPRGFPGALQCIRERTKDVLKILFNYSVIGCVNNSGRWIFHYKDDALEYMPSYPYYCVHYGFCSKLRIQ